jgi:antitoxin (DNA-binding transcriptional repressor) of toxin-antitoxin stability system
MTMIGVRELRQQTAKVLRRIREEKTEYIIIYQGQPVAVMLPVDAAAVEQAIPDIGKQGTAQGWDAYTQVADVVRQRWPQATTTRSLLEEIPALKMY